MQAWDTQQYHALAGLPPWLSINSGGSSVSHLGYPSRLLVQQFGPQDRQLTGRTHTQGTFHPRFPTTETQDREWSGGRTVPRLGEHVTKPSTRLGISLSCLTAGETKAPGGYVVNSDRPVSSPVMLTSGDNGISFSFCINFVGIFLWSSLLLWALAVQIIMKTLLNTASSKNLPAPW